MNIFKNSITVLTQGKWVLFLFILTNLVYGYMLLFTIPSVMEYSNNIKILDMMPMGYDLNYINSLFDTLGSIGRDYYLYTQIPVDMIYPFLFGVSYSILLIYFLKKLNVRRFFLKLGWIPVLAAVADYFENFGIISMLNSYPEINQNQASITTVFTLIKSIGTTLYFLVLMSVLLALVLKYLRKNHKTG